MALSDATKYAGHYTLGPQCPLKTRTCDLRVSRQGCRPTACLWETEAYRRLAMIKPKRNNLLKPWKTARALSNLRCDVGSLCREAPVPASLRTLPTAGSHAACARVRARARSASWPARPSARRVSRAALFSPRPRARTNQAPCPREIQAHAAHQTCPGMFNTVPQRLCTTYNTCKIRYVAVFLPYFTVSYPQAAGSAGNPPVTGL